MPQTPEHPIEKPGPEETLEFLKRHEVRTMAKDVALLREEEAKKEREKIASIKPETAPAPLREPLKEPIKEPLKEPLKEPIKEPESKAPSLIPSVLPQATKLPKRPARFDKVFIRVAIILGATFITLNLVAFAVWNTKKGSAPLSEPVSAPVLVQEPALLFPIERTKTMELSEEGSLLVSLSQLLQDQSDQGFTRVLFKNIAQNRFLALSEVLEGTGFKLAPELGENDTLFLSISGEQKRLGFAASLKDPQSAGELLKAQEKTFEQDVAPLLSLVSQKGQGYVSFFRTVVYKGTGIRCQTFSIQDFGICYVIVKDVLVFATSLESMKQAIDLLVTK